MPHETAAVSERSCKATYVAVTCHQHYSPNDRDLSRATAVTRGWNGYRNKSQNFSRLSCRDWNPRPFNHQSGSLTTPLSALPRSFVLPAVQVRSVISVLGCVYRSLVFPAVQVGSVLSVLGCVYRSLVLPAVQVRSVLNVLGCVYRSFVLPAVQVRSVLSVLGCVYRSLVLPAVQAWSVL